MMLLNIPFILLLSSLTFILGLIVYAYYAMIKCDPLVNKQIKSPNQLLAVFVLTLFEDAPGFSGLFIATLYSGALSSISSSLSGKAANIWEDILKDRLEHRLTESKAALLNRLIVVLLGGVSIGLAYLAAAMPGPMTQISLGLLGAVSGPSLGIFLLGGLFRSANWIGTLVGGLVAFAFMLWIKIGSIVYRVPVKSLPPVSIDGCLDLINATMSTPSWYTHSQDTPTTFSLLNATSAPLPDEPISGIAKLYTISYIWYTFIGTIISVLVGYIISCISGRNSEDVPEELLLSWRRILSCSDDDDEKMYSMHPKSIKDHPDYYIDYRAVGGMKKSDLYMIHDSDEMTTV